MTATEIGELIRDTRKAQGLTQPQLAAASGVGLRFLVELEAGKGSSQTRERLLLSWTHSAANFTSPRQRATGDDRISHCLVGQASRRRPVHRQAWRHGIHVRPELGARAPGARAISVSLPLQAETFSRRQCRPFFEGLLPEESQRIAVAAALGISQQNEFRLLEAIGGEVAGALSLWPEDVIPPETTWDSPAETLSDQAVVALLDRLPTRPPAGGRRRTCACRWRAPSRRSR